MKKHTNNINFDGLIEMGNSVIAWNDKVYDVSVKLHSDTRSPDYIKGYEDGVQSVKDLILALHTEAMDQLGSDKLTHEHKTAKPKASLTEEEQ